MEAINHHPQLALPTNIPNKWVVDCRKVGFGLSSFQYLSRYLYRGVLPDKDIIHITDEEVTFRYKEGGTHLMKIRTLAVLKFLWLILQHVLPKGLQRVRDYGFLRGNAKRLRLQILLLLGVNVVAVSTPPNVMKRINCICPCCQHIIQFMGMGRLSH
jgi:hypothetical protein